MDLETLLNLIACPTIIVLVFVHCLLIEPVLERRGFEPRGVDDARVHRDWRVYVEECGGSRVVYWLMWVGTIVAYAAIILQILQFFFFPGIKLWE